ncbi:MAG: hypothetical protein ISS83_00020 [Candidatus Pacebacteria bacterium]|nr:hypothetical protein [Candidatus Paceibacterota bacterium]
MLYRIVNENAEVLISSLGGTVTSFKVGNEDIFYPWQMVGDKPRGGCPICAPWFGQSVRGPHDKHGHLRNLEALGHNYIGNSLTLSFNRLGDIDYPWSMEYETTVSVAGSGIMSIRLRIKRMRDGINHLAPILPGFHPYFVCNDASKVKVEMAGETYSGFSSEARMILIKDTKINILMPGRKVEMSLLDNFEESSHLVFWTDAPEKYFCVEPILEDKRMFDTPAGQHLEQGQSLDLVVAFKAS